MDSPIYRFATTQRTVSENIFERFCADIGLPCKPVPRAVGKKTPDFDLELNGNIVVAELKQLDPNDSEKALFCRARETGSASGFVATDERIRIKINEANHQLKARSGGCLPSLVVLYDNGTFGGIDSTDIKTAMFGDEKVIVTCANNEVRHVTPLHAGGGRRMTEQCNTTISAVGLLHGPLESALLSVFHNHFAVNPIDPAWCRHERMRHFALKSGCYEWTIV